ncbi:hypothetical protein THERMOT_443 [Bathymodiolus thermophilus thioautotrophic gill symbiont]|uniref:Uncharacterized protein n=1 Tax=Bathymodiolus thermophilus thioautotrophic gill symbiont TaxID=2360 RepID=A0A8H8XBT1_9GAMM|nr:hypothetical protein THERMOS_48 [Bathymodiolus thermophilus thioautotrophic gill symbiont]CAB5496035.1 hypothetical protein THERMOT_443 [Bathymodiolus thermophilus thioautotrophic gill symbiont]
MNFANHPYLCKGLFKYIDFDICSCFSIIGVDKFRKKF